MPASSPTMFDTIGEIASTKSSPTMFDTVSEIASAKASSTMFDMVMPIGIPDILVSKHKGAGNAQAYSLAGGTTLTQIGSDFSIGLLEAPTAFYNPHGYILEFKGKRYVWHRNEIREENTGGAGNWGVVHSITDMQANAGFAQHTGLHIVQVNGVPKIIGLYRDEPTDDTNAIETTDGITWTELGIVETGSNAECGRAIVYRNKLYWRNDSGTDQIICYDPLLVSAIPIIAQGISTTGMTDHDFCVLDNNLYMVGLPDAIQSARYVLWKLQGSQFIRIYTFSNHRAGSPPGGEQGGCALFTDNTDLFAILAGEPMPAAVAGNAMYKIQNPGEAGQVVTDITDPVIPPQYRSSGGSATEDNTWNVFVNNDTRPGLPEIYLWRLPTFTTGNHEAYQFINDSTELVSLGTGPSNDIYLPHTHFGGGERISAGIKIYAEIEQHQAVTNGMQISYRVYESASNVSVVFYYSVREGIPDMQMSLTGAATGGSSSRSGNTIINVTPDNGATLYTAIWDISADGVVETNVTNIMASVVPQ